MNASDQAQLGRFLGNRSEHSLSVDDLQGLLLQISFAIMMVFMIAFFMFRVKTSHDQHEQVLELNRQKLVLAAETVEASYRTRYGLGVLMPPRADGTRAFDPADVIAGGRLTSAPAARAAFADGARAASLDYADTATLRTVWRNQILKAAGLAPEAITPDDEHWLDARLSAGVEGLRADVRGLQRSCAARLQRGWLKSPSSVQDPVLAKLLAGLKGVDDAKRLVLASELSYALKDRSLTRLSEFAGAPMLP